MAETVRLVTEWSTDDPALAETLRRIADVPEWDPIRHEMEAALHTFQARLAWQKAGALRATQQRVRPAPRRATVYGICPVEDCGASVRVNLDGTLRVHDRGSGGARMRSYSRDDRCPGGGERPKDST